MRLYVEKTNYAPPTSGSKRKTLLLDTEDLASNHKLEKMFRIEGIETPQSMVTFETESLPWKSMREGSWYDIPTNLLEQFEYTPANPEAPGGLFLRGHLTAPHKAFDYTSYLSFKSNVKLPTVSYLTGDWDKQLELAVLDCGQGNWNEVRSENQVLIYDLGASQRYTQQDVRDLLDRRDLQLEQRTITAIVSHWDVDHYQAILGMNTHEISKLSKLIAPSQVPNTQTFKRVSNILAVAGVPLYFVPPSVRSHGDGRKIILKPLLRAGHLTAYRAVSGQSRNQTGLVIQVNGTAKTAVLTGDHHYQKVLDAVSGNHPGNPLVLVVPHHGGAAGKLDITKWSKEFYNLEALISTGPNSHGHPFPKVVSKLSTLQGARPLQTDTSGDIVMPI